MRQPAGDVDGDDERHEPRHLAVLVAGRLALHRRAVPGAQTGDEQAIEDDDDSDGQDEGGDQRVHVVGELAGLLLLRRPLHVARHAPAVAGQHDGARVHDDGHNEGAGEQPRGKQDEPRVDGHPHPQRRDREAHGEEAVGAHCHQRERPAEHVDAAQREVDLADGRAEHPAT